MRSRGSAGWSRAALLRQISGGPQAPLREAFDSGRDGESALGCSVWLVAFQELSWKPGAALDCVRAIMSCRGTVPVRDFVDNCHPAVWRDLRQGIVVVGRRRSPRRHACSRPFTSRCAESQKSAASVVLVGAFRLLRLGGSPPVLPSPRSSAGMANPQGLSSRASRGGTRPLGVESGRTERSSHR